MKIDSKNVLRFIALCSIALATLFGTAYAQQTTPTVTPTPSAGFGDKIAVAERALAGAEGAHYRGSRPQRAVVMWDDARTAVSDQIAAGARTLRAVLAEPESLAVTHEATVPAAGAEAKARSYMPPPPKPSMFNRVMGFTSTAAGLGGAGAMAGGASSLIGNYFSLGSSTLGSSTTLLGLFSGNKALKQTNNAVDEAIGKGVDEATQKAAAHAVAMNLKLEFLYAVAALKAVAQELNVIETAAAGKPADPTPLADRYVAALERSEEILDLELPRLAVMAALAANAPELPEETRAKYKAVGERIAATVEQWNANRTLFARSERNALRYLARVPDLQPEAPVTDAQTIAEVVNLLTLHDQALNQHNLNAVIDLFAPGDETVVIGTGLDERYLGKSGIMEAYSHFFQDFDKGTLAHDCYWKTGGTRGDLGWLTAMCKMSDSLAGRRRDYGLNVSAVLERMEDKWLIRSLHFSNLTEGQPASVRPEMLAEGQRTATRRKGGTNGKPKQP